jgi:RIO kinase 1
METPAGLQPLIDDGVIDEVLLSLKSGKEATVYVVRSSEQLRSRMVRLRLTGVTPRAQRQ